MYKQNADLESLEIMLSTDCVNWMESSEDYEVENSESHKGKNVSEKSLLSIRKQKPNRSPKIKTVEPFTSEQTAKVRRNPEKVAETNRPNWSHLRWSHIEQNDSHLSPSEKLESEKNFEDERIFIFLAETNSNPKTYRQTLKSDEKDEWQKAIWWRDQLQINSMYENDVWRLVPREEINQETAAWKADSRYAKKEVNEKGDTK